jgi:hypothetical protein
MLVCAAFLVLSLWMILCSVSSVAALLPSACCRDLASYFAACCSANPLMLLLVSSAVDKVIDARNMLLDHVRTQLTVDAQTDRRRWLGLRGVIVVCPLHVPV